MVLSNRSWENSFSYVHCKIVKAARSTSCYELQRFNRDGSNTILSTQYLGLTVQHNYNSNTLFPLTMSTPFIIMHWNYIRNGEYTKHRYSAVLSSGIFNFGELVFLYLNKIVGDWIIEHGGFKNKFIFPLLIVASQYVYCNNTVSNIQTEIVAPLLFFLNGSCTID